jgi:hypothetical protein
MFEENKEPFQQNCEETTRESTEAIVARKARVTKYEEIRGTTVARTEGI